MSEHISDERLRNTRAWAAARLGQMSGAEVIVGAIDDLLEWRAKAYCGLWLSPSDEPLVFDLWQFRSDEKGSDELSAQLDLEHGVLNALAEAEPIFARGKLQAWAAALRELATKMERAVETGHCIDEPDALIREVRNTLAPKVAPPNAQPARTIDNVTECYIFASSGYVNTALRGGAYTSQHPYETATLTLNVGQRMIVERVDQGVMRLEVLP